MTYDFAEIEKKGEEKGKIEILVQMIKNGFINIQQAAKQLDMSTNKFQTLASEYGLM